MSANDKRGSETTATPDDTTGLETGYGKPPRNTRFKSGKSGNRKGRPRGSKNRKTIFKEIAMESHQVHEGGCLKSRTTVELMLINLRNHMAEGNLAAFRSSHEYLAKYDPQFSSSKYGYLVVPAPMTNEEWIFFNLYYWNASDYIHRVRRSQHFRRTDIRGQPQRRNI